MKNCIFLYEFCLILYDDFCNGNYIQTMRGGKEDTVVIGQVLGPHGLKGEVKVRAAGRELESFQKYQSLLVCSNGNGGKWFDIARVKKSGRGIVLQLDGIHNRDQAESLRGSSLKVKPEQRRSLPEGSYYLFDLIGLDVITRDGRIRGKITDVLLRPLQDILVIEVNGQEFMVPAVKSFIKKIDLQQHFVLIEPIEGLLDGNDD